MMKKPAFSLVEIIVVISIIAILTAIIVSMVINKIKKTKQITCVSNMRQIGISMRQYAQDNDDFYPPFGPGDLGKNFRRIIKKPSDMACPFASLKEKDSNFVPGYASNSLLHGFVPMVSPVRDSIIVSPSSTVMIVEIYGVDAVTSWLARSQQKAKRHNEGGNVLFCDGHVKWYEPSAIRGVGEGTKGSQPAFDFDRAPWQDEPIFP